MTKTLIKINKNIIFFYVPLIIFVVSSHFTLFQNFFNYFEVFALLLLGINVLLNLRNMKKRHIIFMALSGIVIGIVCLNTRDANILKSFMIVIGAYNIRFSECIKVDYYVRLICFALVIFLNAIDILPSYDITRGENIRYSFGFAHPNSVGGRLLIILFEYYYLNGFKNILKSSIITIVVVCLLHYFVDSRTSELLILLVFILGIVFNKINRKILCNKLSRHIICNSYFYMFLLIVVLFIFFRNDFNIGIKANNFLSGRLHLVNVFYNNFGIGLFGNNFNGFISKARPLDIGYAHILLRYGLVIFISLGVCFNRVFKKLYKENNFSYIAILLGFILYLATENTIMHVAFNTFMLIFVTLFYSNAKFFQNKKAKNKKVKNEVIIIGGSHHNMLGVVRAFGENGIMSNLIITHDNKYSFVKKSKYVKNFSIVKENEKEILDILLQKYSGHSYPAVLIPTSDYAEYIIDNNLDKLKEKFIVPSIDGKKFEMKKFMNKIFQYNLSKSYGIDMAKSWELNINKRLIPKDLRYPCILKPMLSIDGKKGDICVCESYKELINSLKKYKELKYKNAILQECIDYDFECNLIGCIHKNQIVLPGIIKKIRRYPMKSGNVSFGKIIKEDSLNMDINKILNILKDINYSGMFDVEIFIKDGMIYLNEINFRNSGNAYLFCYDNVYIVYLWYLMVCGNFKNCNTKIKKEFYFTDENLEIKQLLTRNITFKEWINARKASKGSFIFNKYDKKPVFYKIIYAFLRRIF